MNKKEFTEYLKKELGNLPLEKQEEILKKIPTWSEDYLTTKL